MCIVLFASCGGASVDNIVKKYDAYRSPSVDKAKLRISGLSVGEKGAIIEVVSDNPELNGISANVDLVSKRFIVLDAENPTRILDIQAQTEPIMSNYEAVGYFSRLILQEPKAKVVLVGFKGITATESAEFETNPLFFTVPLDAVYAQTLVTGALVYGGARGVQKSGENDLFSSEHAEGKFAVRTGQLSYDGKKYTFGIGKMSKETDGTTRIYFVAPAFANEYGNGGKGKIPFDTEIIVGNNRIFSEGLRGIGDSFFYDTYVTTVAPDKIIISNDKGETIVFDGKTKAIIKE